MQHCGPLDLVRSAVTPEGMPFLEALGVRQPESALLELGIAPSRLHNKACNFFLDTWELHPQLSLMRSKCDAKTTESKAR